MEGEMKSRKLEVFRRQPHSSCMRGLCAMTAVLSKIETELNVQIDRSSAKLWYQVFLAIVCSAKLQCDLKSGIRPDFSTILGFERRYGPSSIQSGLAYFACLALTCPYLSPFFRTCLKAFKSTPTLCAPPSPKYFSTSSLL